MILDLKSTKTYFLQDFSIHLVKHFSSNQTNSIGDKFLAGQLSCSQFSIIFEINFFSILKCEISIRTLHFDKTLDSLKIKIQFHRTKSYQASSKLERINQIITFFSIIIIHNKHCSYNLLISRIGKCLLILIFTIKNFSLEKYIQLLFLKQLIV